MIVRKMKDIRETYREAKADDGSWTSMRFLLKSDGMGFSLHAVELKAGSEIVVGYKHHLEAVYCIAGEMTVETLKDGQIHDIKAETVYALNVHDKVKIRPRTDVKLISVFTPALTGKEKQQPDGSYPLLADE